MTAFFEDLDTLRGRAIVLALGGLRACEVWSLRLADVDMGLRRVRVIGKGGKERVVPIDGVFFAECAGYLRSHRLRHTYGTELAAAGIDLLALVELMGHASPETTARYVHVSSDTIANEFAAARAVIGR